MKLLMISGDRSILQGKRGAFWYTLEEFSKKWERIDVICPRETKNQKPRTKNQEGEKVKEQFFPNVYFHPSPRGLWYQPWWILQKGSELIAAHHHDVMTVHSYPPFYNDIGAKWLHRSTKIPFMLEVHHVVGYPHAASLSERIGYWMSHFCIPRTARRAAKVRCVSDETAKLLKAWGIDANKIAKIPSFYLDYDALKIDATIEKKFDAVFCGRIVANKGLLELLEAIEEMPNTSLLVIGDGPERAASEKYAHHLGISDRVSFVGWLPTKTKVYETMQYAKILVVNSKSEGGPRVALEAMALEIPIITTRVGVLQEFSDNMVSFTDGTPKDLQRAIPSLLQDPLRAQQMAKNARIEVSIKYGKHLIDQYASALQNL